MKNTSITYQLHYEKNSIMFKQKSLQCVLISILYIFFTVVFPIGVSVACSSSVQSVCCNVVCFATLYPGNIVK